MTKLECAFAFGMMLFLSWLDFQVEGLYFFFIFGVMFVISGILKKPFRLKFTNVSIVNIVFLLLIATTISSFVSDLPVSYKRYAVVMCIILLPMYFVFTQLHFEIKKNNDILFFLVKWMKTGFLIQLIYIPIQFILFKFADIDFNRMLFSDLLSLMETPTFFRQGTFYPSGFTWHSAVLGPMFVFSFLFFDDIRIRILIVFDALICGNLTALVGVVITSMLCLFYNIVLFRKRYTTLKNACIIISCIIGIVFVLMSPAQSYIQEKIEYIMYRLSFNATDTSSQAHFSYYALYPEIVENSSFISLLLGTGYGTSGYAITSLNGQYASLSHWVVESDIMDILISRGFLGFFSYYSFLLYIAFQGRKIDCRYFIAIITLIIQGFGYNVQFEYVFVIELLMLAAVLAGKNIFIERSKG